MVHACCPRYMAAAFARVGCPIAQGALDRQRRLLTTEMRQAMALPLFLVGRDVGAVEEPKGTLVDGCSGLCVGYLEDALVALVQQREAGQMTGEAGADARLGRGGFGAARVQRGGLWVEALDWWTRAGAMDDVLFTVSDSRTRLAVSASPMLCRNCSPMCTSRADKSGGCWTQSWSVGVTPRSRCRRAARDMSGGVECCGACSISLRQPEKRMDLAALPAGVLEAWQGESGLTGCGRGCGATESRMEVLVLAGWRAGRA